jgi:hypothetical protein
MIIHTRAQITDNVICPTSNSTNPKPNSGVLNRYFGYDKNTSMLYDFVCFFIVPRYIPGFSLEISYLQVSALFLKRGLPILSTLKR